MGLKLPRRRKRKLVKRVLKLQKVKATVNSQMGAGLYVHHVVLRQTLQNTDNEVELACIVKGKLPQNALAERFNEA